MIPDQENPRITTRDGVQLHARTWTGRDARGLLVISHGLGEHAGCYAALADWFTRQAGLVDVLAFDYRGHGRSPGRRGVVRRYRDLVHDLEAVLSWANQADRRRPRFVLGHSNGGQVALHAALAAPGLLDGLILSSPCLMVAVEVPAWKLGIGRVLHHVAPWVTLNSGLDDSRMTRDVSLYSARRSDRLRHQRVSAPLFFGMLEGGREVVERAREIRTPTLMVLGEDDQVVDSRAARRLLERLDSPDRTLRTFPGMRHEPLNEIGRESVLAEIALWIEDRLDQSNPPPASARP